MKIHFLQTNPYVGVINTMIRYNLMPYSTLADALYNRVDRRKLFRIHLILLFMLINLFRYAYLIISNDLQTKKFVIYKNVQVKNGLTFHLSFLFILFTSILMCKFTKHFLGDYILSEKFNFCIFSLVFHTDIHQKHFQTEHNSTYFAQTKHYFAEAQKRGSMQEIFSGYQHNSYSRNFYYCIHDVWLLNI